MRHRVSLLSLLTALSLTGTIGLTGAPAQANTTPEARFVSRINEARVSHGLRPLREQSGLTTYARRHSRAMASQGQLFHTSDFSVVCCWSSIGENVGVGFGVKGVHRALMRSAPHRANILSPTMRVVGVGVVRSGGRIWVTQVFKQPR